VIEGTPRNLRYVRGLGKLLGILDSDITEKEEVETELG
jgi:hypothetical protein